LRLGRPLLGYPAQDARARVTLDDGTTETGVVHGHYLSRYTHQTVLVLSQPNRLRKIAASYIRKVELL
jgi:hypothetical protein